MRAGPHTSRAPGVSAPRGRGPRHWAREPGPRRRGKSGSPPLPPRERRFRPRWGGAARAPRPRPPRGPARKGARFPRPACSPRASLPVPGSASPGPDSVTRTASKTVCQRRPGGNGSRTPPLAIRPRGERQGARSPGGETRSPARAPGPLRPSPLPRTSPRALQYTVPEQALVSRSRRPGRATCARLSRAPPPGRSRPAPGHSARGPAPAAFPAPPRPAPAPRPPSAALALPAASPGPPVCLSSLAGGPHARRLGPCDRTECPRAQCFRSGIPALGPAAARRDRECPVPAGKLRAGPAGLPGP
ncbi:potassium/sodium hyperpolarization-activated cyclic nucleotide-gated channel 2-like [Budorcas taxicolor]|uniref:potassium/sodium hyperpolarization-activated cyclic nucleotide-gated channel 2-like n=1 Tax=Budorcas taxicolor TaxID=37181 RepID=UPI0022835AE0|nr:potassium/sodium hyperpolarization-activated cyclic nucleotide-gated channel 2-like [Budorcas taxicolor]